MQELNIHLASPRGFCAGVRRAVEIVEQTLLEFGAPVYVRHEIVHNRHIIEGLRRRGVVFIEEWKEIKDKTRPLILSAHGVSQKVRKEAEALGMKLIDATCPLVEKVHIQMRKLAEAGKNIIIIGKPAHVEVIGTAGQVEDKSRIHIVQNLEDVEKLPSKMREVGFVTQTTLSKGETKHIVEKLKKRFPSLEGMKKDDICYATTNRQKAVAEVAGKCEAVLIVGSQNSSNSQSLKKVAENFCPKAFLIDDAAGIPYGQLSAVKNLGISAGASAPDYLIEEVLNDLSAHYDKINISYDIVAKEEVSFKDRRK